MKQRRDETDGKQGTVSDEITDEEKATLWNWQIPIDELCGSCDGKEAPVLNCFLCLGTGREQPGWEQRAAQEAVDDESPWPGFVAVDAVELARLRVAESICRKLAEGHWFSDIEFWLKFAPPFDESELAYLAALVEGENHGEG